MAPRSTADDRDLERQRDRLEACLAAAVSAVEGLAPPSRPAPPPFESSYGLDAAEDDAAYARWVALRSARRRASGGAPIRGPDGELPSISLVVVVHRPDSFLLGRCVSSITAQATDAWQLVLAPVSASGQPGSTEHGVIEQIREIVERDPRILAVEPAAGTVEAANLAAAHADAPFLAFLGQHDELDPEALGAVAVALGADDEIDLLYTDEDEIDQRGGRRAPRFKPDWSPDLLLSTPYVGHLLVVRRALFEAVGGLRAEHAGSEHFDLALRAAEGARHVEHVPHVAYHRRAEAGREPGDAATDEAALRSALERRGDEATVEAGLEPGGFRIRRRIRSSPLVSIIVPFRDGAELLRRCVASLAATAGYDRWELLLVDNLSWEPETMALLRRLSKAPNCRIVSYPHAFNWSAVNNFGATQTNGELLLFLNSDVEGSSPGWLAAMIEHAQRAEVGAVGARLLYPDGSIQHAGVVMGLGGGVAWHPFCGCPGDRGGYLGQAKLVRNCSAVTGACMLVRRDAFDSVGRLDESLPVCFNDVDLCLRLRAAGLLVVYTPFAELVHYESSTRGRASPAGDQEIDMMLSRWAPVIEDDPYLNPNLDRLRAEFSLPR